MRALPLILAILTSAVAHADTDVPLVRRGRPTAVLVLPLGAEADVVTAVRALQAYVEKISGASLSIVPDAAPQAASVRIGIYGHTPGFTGTAPPRDGFAIERHGRSIFIVGGDARGALYGTYDVLETDLGVRWFMPGELGEDVLPRPSVALSGRARTGRPAFEAVGGFAWASGPGAAEWERHLRADVGPPSSFFGHNWSNIIPPTAANKAAHPEWFAWHDGVRTDQLCSGNAEVVALVTAQAKAFFDEHPEAAVFSISPNDGLGFCEDERCRSIDRLFHVADGSLSDRLVYFANEVLTGLASSHPQKQVGLLAYMNYIRPPIAVRPLPNLAVMVTHMPWEFCHVHALDDAQCELNRRFVDDVRGWQRVSSHVAVYEYYGHFNAFTPWPLVHNIRRDLPFLHRLGVSAFMSETQPHWANQGLNFYVAAKLAWNPDLDVDNLLHDYFVRFYGPAAEPMRRYWQLWEDAMAATARHGHGGYAWQGMFTPELIAEADGRLQEAERGVAGAAGKFARRVAFARSGFRYTAAWTRMRAYADRREWGRAIAAGEDAIACAEETDGAVPQAFRLPLLIRQTRAQMAGYRAALAGP